MNFTDTKAISLETIGSIETLLSVIPSSGICPDGLAFSPTLNMALDSWMAESAPLAMGESFLRIYRWEPAGISIGRNQSWRRAIDCGALLAGENAVRRVTGGRAIYHDSAELTYSFVTRVQDKQEGGATPLAAGKEIAELIVKALLRFMREAGLDAQAEKSVGYVPAHRQDRQSPHCFVSTARHELTVEGMKVVASAQRVQGGRFFQHGSIKLGGVVRHPALFDRPLRKDTSQENQLRAGGNKSTHNECYSKQGKGADSSSTGTGLFAQGISTELRPHELRKAFMAIFGEGLSAPVITSQQMAEVSRHLADIDYIVGTVGLTDVVPNTNRQFLSLTNSPHKDNPYLGSPHGDSPHRDNLQEDIFHEDGAGLVSSSRGILTSGACSEHGTMAEKPVKAPSKRTESESKQLAN